MKQAVVSDNTSDIVRNNFFTGGGWWERGVQYDKDYNMAGADPGGGAQGALAPPPPSLTHTPHTPTCDTHKAQTCNTASI